MEPEISLLYSQEPNIVLSKMNPVHVLTLHVFQDPFKYYRSIYA
jgi:hypothetical protein